MTAPAGFDQASAAATDALHSVEAELRRLRAARDEMNARIRRLVIERDGLRSAVRIFDKTAERGTPPPRQWRPPASEET